MDITGLDEDRLARYRRDHVGIVFQHFHLVPTMTALENVALPLEFAGARDVFGRARVQLEAVGLGHRLSHYPSQLSGGEQQRVALARAFVGEPAILLADEPTGNLDPELSREVMTLFARFNQVGTTVLIASHDLDLIRETGYPVICLSQGEIVHNDLAAVDDFAASA
jgi:putative ABC transport system ATP-binding protein